MTCDGFAWLSSIATEGTCRTSRIDFRSEHREGSPLLPHWHTFLQFFKPVQDLDLGMLPRTDLIADLVGTEFCACLQES